MDDSIPTAIARERSLANDTIKVLRRNVSGDIFVKEIMYEYCVSPGFSVENI